MPQDTSRDTFRNRTQCLIHRYAAGLVLPLVNIWVKPGNQKSTEYKNRTERPQTIKYVRLARMLTPETLNLTFQNLLMKSTLRTLIKTIENLVSIDANERNWKPAS